MYNISELNFIEYIVVDTITNMAYTLNYTHVLNQNLIKYSSYLNILYIDNL